MCVCHKLSVLAHLFVCTTPLFVLPTNVCFYHRFVFASHPEQFAFPTNSLHRPHVCHSALDTCSFPSYTCTWTCFCSERVWSTLTLCFPSYNLLDSVLQQHLFSFLKHPKNRKEETIQYICCLKAHSHKGRTYNMMKTDD